MIACMSNKPKRPVGRPHNDPATETGKRSTELLQGRLPVALVRRFDAFIAKHNARSMLRVGKSAHIEKAILMYLDSEEKLLGV